MVKSDIIEYTRKRNTHKQYYQWLKNAWEELFLTRILNVLILIWNVLESNSEHVRNKQSMDKLTNYSMFLEFWLI